MPRDYKKSRSSKNSSSGSRIPPWFWMLVGFAPGILVAVLLYLDRTDPTRQPHKSRVNTVQTVRTATLTQTGRQATKAVRKNTTHKHRRSVEGDNDKIKYTFYLKLLNDETIVGDKQIRREARKYRQQLRRAERTERIRLRKIKQRKIKLAKRKKRQQADAAKKAQKKKNKKRNLKLAAVKAKNRKKKIRNNKVEKKAKSKKIAKQKPKQRKKKLKVSKKKAQRFPNYILIQAGSFRKKKQADQHRAKLALYGVKAVISSATIKGEMWYRVRVGPFRSYKDMKSKLAKLRKRKVKVMPIRVGHKKNI